MADHPLLSDGQTLYNPDTWLDKNQAAAFVGSTPRTIERWVKEKGLTQLLLRQAAKHPVAVYFKPELERLKAERTEATPTRREPTAPTAPQPDSKAVATKPPTSSTLPNVALDAPVVKDLLAYFAQEIARQLVPLDRKPYLTLKEARVLSNLPEKALKEFANSGKIRRWPGKKYILKTEDVLSL
jgi:hypothetical protein